jgi:hypothetical protein
MITISLVMTLLSATPTTNGRSLLRETKVERAARLMTDGELAHLADLDRQIAGLRAPENGAFLTASIATLAAGLALPALCVVAGVVTSVAVGLVGLLFAAFGDTEVLAWIPSAWVAIFSVIPIWGWVAIAAVTVVGAAMLTASLTADAPRRAQLAGLRAERKALITEALSRPETSMQQVPMLPLATF